MAVVQGDLTVPVPARQSRMWRNVRSSNADRADRFLWPQHRYAEALLSAVPEPEPGIEKQRIILRGDVPSPINPPSGCRFHTRCPYGFDRCSVEEPELQEISAAHYVACHLREPAAHSSSGASAQSRGS